MKVAKRRRRENKTDYANRIRLLKSGCPRVVFRKTNRYIIAQYLISKQAQDKIEIGINSKNLTQYGWPKELEKSLKSIPASYLTGLLMGKKIIRDKKEIPIIDFGMLRTLHKTKVYAFLKGLTDAGVKIKCREKPKIPITSSEKSKSKEDIFPSEDRIKGKHMKKDFSKIFEQIKSKIEKL